MIHGPGAAKYAVDSLNKNKKFLKTKLILYMK
jgi:hypothetical protein